MAAPPNHSIYLPEVSLSSSLCSKMIYRMLCKARVAHCSNPNPTTQAATQRANDEGTAREASAASSRRRIIAASSPQLHPSRRVRLRVCLSLCLVHHGREDRAGRQDQQRRGDRVVGVAEPTAAHYTPWLALAVALALCCERGSLRRRFLLSIVE